MDPTQAIILTTIFNVVFTSLVGGIIIYTLQKKIDATIQKSLFEHQTKFTINHTKTIETLDTLYKKFVAFYSAITDLIAARRHSREEDWGGHQREQARTLLQDLWKYYKDHHLYVPGEITDKLDGFDIITEKILLIIEMALGSARTKLQRGPRESDLSVILVWESRYLETALKQSGNDGVYHTPETLLEEQCEQLIEITRYLEVSYKSVAEAK